MYLKLPAYMLVLIYLDGPDFCPNLGILIWAAKMLPGVVNEAHIQIIESVVILWHVHWKTS